MARNIQSIVMIVGFVVCSIMVLQTSGQATCPAPVNNVTYCPLYTLFVPSTNCTSTNGVIMTTLASMLAAPALAAGLLVGLAGAAISALGQLLVNFGQALMSAVAAGTATTAAPAQIQFRPLLSFFGR